MGKTSLTTSVAKQLECLKIKSVYKQGSNYYPQVYVEEAKIKPVENSKYGLLSDSEDDYKWL